jgi:hypothetical protein
MFNNVFRRPQQSIPHKQMKEVHIPHPTSVRSILILAFHLQRRDKIMETLDNIGIKLFVLAAL